MAKFISLQICYYMHAATSLNCTPTHFFPLDEKYFIFIRSIYYFIV